MPCKCGCLCVLMIVNIVVLLFGLAITIFGAVVAWNKEVMEIFLEVNKLAEILGTKDTDFINTVLEPFIKAKEPVGVALFVIGLIVTIVAAIGCVGACCDSSTLLYLYALILGIIKTALLIAVIVYFAKKDIVQNLASELYKKPVDEYKSMKAKDKNSLIVFLVQKQFQCCGFKDNSFPAKEDSDIFNTKIYKSLQYPIPCCKIDSDFKLAEGCGAIFSTENSNIDTPCKGQIEKFVNIFAYVIIGLIVILAILNALTILTVKIY